MHVALVCVSDVIEWLTVWQLKKPKTKNHVEHHTASAPRCSGADDQCCVEMIKWGDSPTCMLHLLLMDWLANFTPSHCYPRAPCAIPVIKIKSRRKINGKMVRIAHGASGSPYFVASWFIQRSFSMRDRLPAHLIMFALSIHFSPLALLRHLRLQSDYSFLNSFIISWSNSLFLHGFFIRNS